jgi:UDP-glucose 4-epimerase
MKLLITGGAGYIGSHAVLQGLQLGYDVYVIDSLVTGNLDMLEKIRTLSTNKNLTFHKVDLTDKEALDKVVDEIHPDFTMHFAALKSVGEGEKFPEQYHFNNVIGTTNLVNALVRVGSKLVFSSTAAVYDATQPMPVTEESKLGPINIYGKTKLQCENVIKNSGLKYVIFRYFNVVGNNPDGLIGEKPEKCTNFLPIVMQTLAGKREKTTIFGANYKTADGFQERDYIDILDLVDAHFLAISYLEKHDSDIINLATGKPSSCKEIMEEAEAISGKKLAYEIGEHRVGDPESIYADPQKALKLLNWSAKRSLHDSVVSQWLWTKKYYQID